jgi:site-specific DNA-methyltransferase (adenine-specific)
MAVQIEDAGFEIRDMIAWVYGSGFPKSMNVGKEMERRGFGICPTKEFEGWGTALKPALEPITVARKPLVGTVAANVLEHGTGAINVDGCRVGTEGGTTRSEQAPYAESGWRTGHQVVTLNAGRWPANLIHDGSDEVVGLFPHSVSTGGSGPASRGHKSDGRTVSGSCSATGGFGDSGSAARFFYCAKASKADRDEGLTLPPQSFVQFQTGNGASGKPSSLSEVRDTQYRNTHPTVKPTELMRYLCRLVTPPGGVVLDPFMGSGSTGKAAVLEGFRFIGIEREAEYLEIARGRIQLPEQGSLL